MPSNSLLHFVTKIIKFEEMKVSNYHFLSDNELLIELVNKEKKATCSHCQATTDKVHQSHWFRIRDIPISGYHVFLNINRRQFRCKKCGKIFSEELNFVKKRRTYTKRLAAKVVREVLETDVVNTANRNRMSPAEIETLLRELEDDLDLKKSKKFSKKTDSKCINSNG